jgi:hypothetical protein
MTTTTATVNAANAYRQIITNFSNPLEFVREAIQRHLISAKAHRAFRASAMNMWREAVAVV